MPRDLPGGWGPGNMPGSCQGSEQQEQEDAQKENDDRVVAKVQLLDGVTRTLVCPVVHLN